MEKDKGDPTEKALINLSKQMLKVEAQLQRLRVGLTVLRSSIAMEFRPKDPKAYLRELHQLEDKLLNEVDSKAAQERQRAEKLFDLLLRDDVKLGDHEA
jgi:hypothetical protein